MYLKTIHSINVGPIDDVKIIFPFNEDKTPKPVVIVGENGTGKSVLLSNIVDSFYEIAGKFFNDVRKMDDFSFHQQFYKIIGNQEVKIGKKYMYSYIVYESVAESNSLIEYLFKSGDLSVKDFCDSEEIKHNYFSWNDVENYKNVKVERKKTEHIFNNSVICYFPPSRYERPNWLGEKYYAIEKFEHPSVKEKFSGRLDKPISIIDVTLETLQWLLDVIADSRCDVEYEKESGFRIAHVKEEDVEYYSNLIALGNSRKNIESIMSTILGQEVYFGLNYRITNSSRFNINDVNGKILIPTLNALSTGQSALFNMCATIIRYADLNDMNKSIRLEDITGIVVIDEIELHLHSNFQREVLPKLLKKFPKVQFIISSHSPLFLLGMDEVYGRDGYEIYQMPSAIRVTSERFSEFEKAYKYLSDTETHQREIRGVIQEHKGKPLVVTEGQSDWKHMKAAFAKLKFERQDYLDMDFEFLEYDQNTQMGNTTLEDMCRHFSTVQQSRKIIFIADADVDKTSKALGKKSAPFYRDWGNNVFSFVLPVPEHRKDTPEICIEHYYTDNEIKTDVTIEDGTTRRLYLGNEFNKQGISFDRNFTCSKKDECGKGSIKIIDGNSKSRVYSIEDDECSTNLALPKMKFADSILNHSAEFENINFDNFHLIFDLIKKILEQSNV